jgi:hypothetical protein
MAAWFEWFGHRRHEPYERPLDLVPVPLIASTSTAEGGEAARVVLLEPRFRGGPFAAWMQARLPAGRAHVRVALDERGSTIWRLLDGRRNVADVMRGFVAAHPQEAEQASERVWLFLSELGRHGFVRLRDPHKPAPGSRR